MDFFRREESAHPTPSNRRSIFAIFVISAQGAISEWGSHVLWVDAARMGFAAQAQVAKYKSAQGLPALRIHASLLCAMAEPMGRTLHAVILLCPIHFMSHGDCGDLA